MRPRVDVLIGLDCVDLHHAVEEVLGRPGEPIARLKPLGWTCIRTPGSNKQPKLQTRFSSTFFVHDQTELEKMNMNLKKSFGRLKIRHHQRNNQSFEWKKSLHWTNLQCHFVIMIKCTALESHGKKTKPSNQIIIKWHYKGWKTPKRNFSVHLT